MSTADAPFFSIIACARNAGTYARRSIESVLAQTETSWQLIFVDDASDDGETENCLLALGDTPLGVIETATNTGVFCHEPNFVYLRMRERNWKLKNWLLVMLHIEGQILVELDGDDFFARPDALSIIKRAYDLDPRVEATAGSFFGYPSGSIVHACRQPARGYRIMQNGFADSVPAPRTWKKALTTRSLADLPSLYVDPSTGQLWRTNADLALFAPALFWAEEIATIDDVLVNVGYDAPEHDFQLPQQREEGLRLYEILYQAEWTLSAPLRKVFEDA